MDRVPGNGDRAQDVMELHKWNEENLIVGTESCSFVDVRDTLNNLPSSGKLWLKLIEVARSLKIPSDKEVTLQNLTRNNTVTYPDALYEILETWRQTFSSDAKLHTLIEVLESLQLNDCADSLRIRFYAFEDAFVGIKLQELSKEKNLPLPEYISRWKNLKNVKFQGNEVKLEDLAHKITTTEDRKILDELALGKTPCIVNDMVPKELNYYTGRTIRCRNILEVAVLKERCKDVFLIEGMEKFELSLHVPDNESTDVSGSQIVNLTVRFILLQHESDFTKICKLAKTPVHWVKYQNGNLELVKSSGSVQHLQKHIHDCQDSFPEVNLASIDQKAIIIADSPGMGKTSLLANIAHQIMREQPTMVVRFIGLNEFVDGLKTKKINAESIVKQIAKTSSEYEFGRKLVENSLMTENCVLLFDGLDEVHIKKISRAMEVLEAAVALPLARVYVSTRPHFRDELENVLHVLSYTMEPLDQLNQVNVILKYWEMKGLNLNESLTKLAEHCVSHLNLKKPDTEQMMTGIPLQLQLIAEIYEEQAKRCLLVGYEETKKQWRL